MNQFTCNNCTKTFSHNRTLVKHIKLKHTGSPTKFDCDLCSFSSDSKFSLTRHVKVKHLTPKTDSGSNDNVKCPLCKECRATKHDIVQHYTSQHDISIVNKTLNFPNETEFFNWKNATEKEEVCEFVVWRSKYINKKDGSGKMTLRCHRDGDFKSDSKHLRHCKMLGSNKINGHCPAKIDVTFHTSGEITVLYCKTHVGHEPELGRSRLSEAEKTDIAAKIAMKIPFDKILDGVRDSINSSELERIHLITRKDLFNIEQQYSLKSEAVRHSNDCTSVESWIKEMEEAGDVVCFYKPQGVLMETHSHLQADDFILIMMNEAQREMLRRYGNNCVCLDSTHGLNNYGFELTTLLVLDDLAQGFPCAFMFSNRSDTCVVEIFLTVLRDALSEPLQPKVFMSDMAEIYYNAWVMIMAAPKFRLFCSWHVDRAWRKNLSKVNGREKQAEVYKLLRTLLEERDETAFSRMLEQVIVVLKNDTDTRAFGLYFENMYKPSASNWAYCHRLHAGLNTNMHLERMHGVLKHIYMGGKKPKRLDITIHTIMTFVRDKLYDRLIHLHKGKVTSKLSIIRKRHQRSLSLSEEGIICEEEIWSVPSFDRNEIYKVSSTDMDNCNCGLQCTECKTCIHAYICSCVDSAIKFNMCKHIHLIRRIKLSQTSREENEPSESSLIIQEQPNVEEQVIILRQLKNSETISKFTSIEEKKTKLLQRFQEILNKVDSEEDIEIVSRLIKPILPSIQARKSKFLPTPEPTAPKVMKFEPQRRLFSTKKSHKKTSLSISRPTNKEQDDIAAQLLFPETESSISVNNV